MDFRFGNVWIQVMRTLRTELVDIQLLDSSIHPILFPLPATIPAQLVAVEGAPRGRTQTQPE